MAYMNRVVAEVEKYDDYEIGETELVLVGEPYEIKTVPGLDKYEHIIGDEVPYAMWCTNSERCKAYFDYVLLNPALIADEQTFDEMNQNEIVKSMPCFPQKGSIQYIDDVLVVKLGKEYSVN